MLRPAEMSGGKDNVQVVVRCRPLFGKEIAENRERIVEMDLSRGQVSLRDPKGGAERPETKHYTFDKIFDWNCAQKDVYDGAAARIVDASIEGYNGTIFCYGQTGTGKTHTMEGKDDPPSERGILPHAFRHVFDAVAETAGPGVESLVRASFLEIYNENVRDLLAKDQTKTCALKETPEKGVYVDGLTTFVVKSAAEMHNILQVGKKNRSVGATLMNADSSRSHSIFTVTVETSRVRPGDPPGAEPHITVGKLNLVDLAGSERQSKTQASGDRLKEATKINLSLSALGNVISALVDGKSQHIPYRDSKLTRLLQDSLGGNTKTVMIANVGPADYNFDETMSTLRYANRAKNIKNKPKINEDPKDAMLREFQEEIARLKAQLERGGGDAGAFDANASFTSGGYDGEDAERAAEADVDPDEDQLAALRREVAAEMEASMRDAGSVADLAKIKEKAEAGAREEMEKMMRAKDASVEERERVRRAMEEQSVELELQLEEARRDRERRDATEARLREMESKLIHGVDDLEKRNRELEEEARAEEDALEERAVGNEEAARKIEALEREAKKKREDFTQKKDAVAEITRKLRGQFGKYQSAKADLEAHARALRREKEDMVDSINLLRRQLDLKETLIDAFVPPETAAKVTAFAVWEDDAERWVLEKISDRRDWERASSTHEPEPEPTDGEQISELRAARLSARRREKAGLRPTCDADELRPTCDRARVAVAMGDTNPRYVSENVLRLALDPAERTTFDLFGEEARLLDENENGTLNDPRDAAREAAAGVQAVLDIAFARDRGARLPRTAPPAARRGSTPPRPRVTRRCAPPATARRGGARGAPGERQAKVNRPKVPYMFPTATERGCMNAHLRAVARV